MCKCKCVVCVYASVSVLCVFNVSYDKLFGRFSFNVLAVHSPVYKAMYNIVPKSCWHFYISQLSRTE